MIRLNAFLDVAVGKKGHRHVPVRQIEAFSIDNALDTDADQFSIDIGAPDPDLKFLINRDNEVRVTLFTRGVLPTQVEHLHSGIADIVEFSGDDQIISLNGRDYSCVATDSQAPPGVKKHVRPHVFIAKEARALGFGKMKLQPVSELQKFYRDGSETYWESWYRMCRKRKIWLWTEPDGTLVADKLHYSASPTFFFGWKHKTHPNAKYIKVEACQITSNKQQRIHEIWVFGERGDIGFRATQRDSTIDSWKRKPLKIMTSSKSHNHRDATEEAREEIFESKVGALEIQLTIAHSAFGGVIRQNRMAFVNIPQMGLTGIFFIVGSAIHGSADGYTQVVRLREKNFAISRRIPDDPKLTPDPAAQKVGSEIASNLPFRWAECFVSSAREFHDGWDLQLWLGVLIAIGIKESGLRNVREGGDTEWYEKPVQGRESPGGPNVGPNFNAALEAWYNDFANDPGNPRNPFGRDAGVGPMQLTTHSYKVQADTYGDKHDEYEGGRWMPCPNIRAAAKAFAGKLAGFDPGTASQIWIGVARYNGSGAAADAYAADVKKIYEGQVKDQLAAGFASAESTQQGTRQEYHVKDKNGNPFTIEVPDNAPDAIVKLTAFLVRQLGKPYEWGADGPNTYDCSGLALAAYRSIGFPLAGHNTHVIFDSGLEKVTKDNLLMGDMVFFENVEHMGIYMNDNHMIVAPHTGAVVWVQSLSDFGGDYDGARRRVSWSGRGSTSGD